MGRIGQVDRMVDVFLQVHHEDQLFEGLERATSYLGFSQFAMGHHVDLLRPPENAIRMCNYNPAWIERSIAEGLYVNDPVHHASTQTAVGFLWSAIPRMIRLSPRQSDTLDLSRSYGLREGYTVPVHVPQEYRGSCSFAATDLSRLRRNALPIANSIGLYAFEAARRIMRRRTGPASAGAVPVLTNRQHDALVLMARGKGDSEIGTLLGIAASTAHEHIENVRRAYGNAQRVYLVVRALFDGQISYGEVFGR